MTFQVLPGVKILATKTKHRFFHTQKHRVLLGTNLACLDELKKHKCLKKGNSFMKVLNRYAFLPHKILPTKHPFANKLKMFLASKMVSVFFWAFFSLGKLEFMMFQPFSMCVKFFFDMIFIYTSTFSQGKRK